MPLLHQLRRRLGEDPRLERMLHGGFSGLLGRGFALLVSAISLPLTVRYLGKLEYGVWITISSSIAMLSVLDLGIANTLTNHIAEAFARDDRAQAKRAFATAFWLTCALSAVFSVLLAAVWHAVHWAALLHLADPVLAGRARLAVAISIGYFLLSMPLNLANRVLSGYQKVHIANYFAMLNSLLGLGAILVVIVLHGTLVSLMLAYCIAMLGGSVLLNLWLLLLHHPWLRPHPALYSRTLSSALFRQGSLFFLLQLTGLVVFNSDNLVIAHYLGAQEVTPYSIAWRLISYAAMLQSLVIPSLWPAFTEAYHKRELTWVRTIYGGLVRKTLLAVSIAACLIGIAGRSFIRVYAGAAAVPSPLLLWTMALWAVLVATTTNQALLLTATGRLRLEATVAVIAAVVNLFLSIYLVQRIGAEGVILATILSFAVCMVVPQQMEVRRVLRGDFLAPEATPHASPDTTLESVALFTPLP